MVKGSGATFCQIESASIKNLKKKETMPSGGQGVRCTLYCYIFGFALNAEYSYKYRSVHRFFLNTNDNTNKTYCVFKNEKSFFFK